MGRSYKIRIHVGTALALQEIKIYNHMLENKEISKNSITTKEDRPLGAFFRLVGYIVL